MLKTFIAAALISLGTAATAHAGCYDYSDAESIEDAPLAELCFDGKCEDTIVVVICSSMYQGITVYANGWQVWWTSSDTAPIEITASLGDRLLTTAETMKFKCKSEDARACVKP